jgi:hypothetical protein
MSRFSQVLIGSHSSSDGDHENAIVRYRPIDDADSALVRGDEIQNLGRRIEGLGSGSTS